MVDTRLSFGLMTYEAAPWSELVERWRWFEDLGYDSLWSGDHVWSKLEDGKASRPRFDAWQLVAGMVSATRRVTVGPMVSSIAYRNPVVVAKQAVTLDHMSGGRLVVGIGAGGNPADHATAGVSCWPQEERVARFAESVAILDGLLTEDSFDFDGEHYTVQGGVRAPMPVQSPRPPLTVAAHIDQTLQIAARHADTWSSYGTLFSQLRRGEMLSETESLRVTRKRSQRLDEFADAAGRDPAGIRRSFMAGFTKDEIWTSAEAFRDFVGRFAEIGITEFVFPWPLQGKTTEGMFEEISENVIPELQGVARS